MSTLADVGIQLSFAISLGSYMHGVGMGVSEARGMVVSLRTLRHSLKALQLTHLQTSSVLLSFALFLDFLHAWRWAGVGQSLGGVDGSPLAAYLDCFDTWNGLSFEGFFFLLSHGMQ